MKTITKTLPTGVVTTQSKEGNTIRINVSTKQAKKKLSKMNLLATIAVCFLFSLASFGITGFTIMWSADLIQTFGLKYLILFPFIVGVNYINFILVLQFINLVKTKTLI